MKASLKAGIESEFRYTVQADKTVPALYPEAAEFQEMPAVFATGFLVGLLEWACISAINPHLDWPSEQTLGTHIDVSHSAPTPPGLEVTVHVKLIQVSGRKLRFEVEASDGVHVISTGSHERFVIDREPFVESVTQKAAAASG